MSGRLTIKLTLYEPRWHGFALWKLERFHSNEISELVLVEPIAKGRWRPPRWWTYRQFDLRQAQL